MEEEELDAGVGRGRLLDRILDAKRETPLVPNSTLESQLQQKTPAARAHVLPVRSLRRRPRVFNVGRNASFSPGISTSRFLSLSRIHVRGILQDAVNNHIANFDPLISFSILLKKIFTDVYTLQSIFNAFSLKFSSSLFIIEFQSIRNFTRDF